MPLSNISSYLHGGLPPPDPDPAPLIYDINVEYLSSDAVANFMHMADSNDDNHLSTQELADFINQQLPTQNDTNGEPMLVTAEAIQNLLPTYSNNQSLAHFEVFFILGLYYGGLHNNVENALYHVAVHDFNVRYGGNISHANPNNNNNDNDASGGKKRKSRKTQRKRKRKHCVSYRH